MTEKITSLTPEQEARLVAHRQEYLDIGSSTEPADWPRAEAAIVEMYKIINKTAPRFVHTRSPLEAARVLHALRHASDELGWALVEVLDTHPTGVVTATNTAEYLKTMLTEKWWAEIDRLPKRTSRENTSFWGSQDAYWVSYYTYARDTLGVQYEEEQNRRLNLWDDIVRSIGWWYPFDNICVISDRPEIVRWTDEDVPRIHCADGPCVRYRDGWSVYAWRGTVVPREWIEDKDSLAPETALTWENVEQRRCAAEILGWAKILETLKYRVIDEHPNPMTGKLIEADLPDAPGSRFMVVLCGTGRTFALPVPEEMKTAEEAQAWMWSMDVEEYRQLGPQT